ncbi:MAG: hypothetical protein ACYTG0_14455 [Planctomycetota bacterium]|jgi:hypothetical protein
MTTLTLLAALSLGAGADDAITLDATRQLFLDDCLVASSENVTRRIHPAEKHSANPVLRATEPWENEVAIVYGSILREEDKHRAWYYASGHVGYAESPDGLRWTKPRLGIVEIDGQNTNLVIRRGGQEGQPGTIPYFYEIFGVHRDDKDPDPSGRYKMGYLSIDRNYRGPREGRFHAGQRRGLGVAASPDGIRWRLLQSWATEAICDGATHWAWDPSRGKYLLYGRTKHVAPGLLDAWGDNEWVRRHFWGRSVARVESPDFVHWNVTQPAKGPVVMTADARDPPGTEIYSMQVFPYESVYIGLVQVFHNRPDACHLDVQLAVSRDSIRFTRVGDRTPFLPVGPVGTWDRFNLSLANNRPVPAGDELRFYYGGRSYRHGPYQGEDKGRRGGGIGLATVPRDRFVSLGASFDGGRLVTRKVRLAGNRLHLNAKSDFGQIVVEVLDRDGRVLARSEPVEADGFDLPVAWEEGGLEEVRDPVVLRITLNNALLFALWCS